MKPPPSRDEGEGGGKFGRHNGRLLATSRLPRTQAPTLASWDDLEQLIERLAFIADWKTELERRIKRAKGLVSRGLRDPGFRFLVQEVDEFNRDCLVCVGGQVLP